MNYGIMAGGRGERLGVGIPKAFVKLNDKNLYEYVLNAVCEVRKPDDKIFIVYPKDFPISVKGVISFPSVGHHFLDIFQVIDASKNVEELVIINADAVLINEQFLLNMPKSFKTFRADVVWPIILKEDMFPDDKKAIEGNFLGNSTIVQGNICYMNPQKVSPDPNIIGANSFWSYLKALKYLRMRKIIKACVGLLTIEEMEEIFGKILRCQVKMPIYRYPEMAFDVDYQSQLELAKQKLACQAKDNKRYYLR